MVAALDLGSNGVSRGGSSPPIRTIHHHLFAPHYAVACVVLSALRRVLCLRHTPLTDVSPFRHHTALDVSPFRHHTALSLVWCYLREARAMPPAYAPGRGLALPSPHSTAACVVLLALSCVLCLRHTLLADVSPFRHHTALPLVWCYLR